MKKTLLVLSTLMLTLVASVALVADNEARNEDDRDEWYESRNNEGGSLIRSLFRDSRGSTQPVSMQNNQAFQTYLTECGDCHIAYPPNMLPKASWQRMMANLDEHFGDNAELDAAKTAEISAFLERHADGRMKGSKGSKGSRKFGDMRRDSSKNASLRITETAWFRAKHHEIPKRIVQNNPEILSFSRCDACHTNAAKGSYNEHDIRIPGYGRWDD
jgi:hypothetical protein